MDSSPKMTCCIGHCQDLPPLCPLHVDTVAVGSQRGLPCVSITMVTTGQEPLVDGFPVRPYLLQILQPSRQGPSTFVAILSDHPQQSTVLTRCGFPRSHRGLAWHQSSSGRMPPKDLVDGGTGQTHATNNSTLPRALGRKYTHFRPNTHRAGHY